MILSLYPGVLALSSRLEEKEMNKRKNVPRMEINEKTSKERVLSDEKMEKKDKENNWLEA